MFKTIQQLIAILDPASRLHFALTLVPMLVITALEVASIGLILPVIQVLLLGRQDGMLTAFILNALPAAGRDDPGLWVSGLFIVFFVGKNILMLAMIYAVNWVVTHKTAVYTKRMFLAYLSRPLIFHYRNNSANLFRNITTGIDSSLESVRLILMMTLDALLMLGAIVLLAFVEPMATFGVIAILIMVGLAIFGFFSPIFHRWGEQSMALEGTVIKLINQSLTGIRDVKLLDAHGNLGRRLGDAAFAHAHYACRIITSIHIPRLLIETIVIVIVLGVVFVLLSDERRTDEIIAMLGLYGMATLRLMPSLNRLLTSATDLRRRAPYISVIFDDLSSAGEETPPAIGNTAQDEIPFEREIRLENIAYTYPDAAHHALHGIDLTVPKGQSVGILGKSGAGKSTLMDIILGLLRPDQGRLLVDGRDAYESLPGWRRRIGFVPQQVFLLDDTVLRNVAFGIEDADIDEDQVKKALRLARLDDLVLGLPDGLETVLGEHGTRLSGGQRQRIAIARALYRDPDLLMFDEATSALDNETENEISTAIEALTGEKTVLIVAHRLSTVRRCDVIAFMKDGRIAGTGTFEELVNGNSDFELLVRVDGFGAVDERVEVAS
jgi:ABC-type multidrug transport system fused ATPase/permease subunit